MAAGLLLACLSGAARATSFAEPASYRVGRVPVAIAVADLNGDGRHDLITADRSSDGVSALLNLGGTFGSAVASATGLAPTSVAAADLDADLNADIAVTNGGMNTVSVLMGDGTGAFQSRVAYRVGNGPADVDLADLDGDGDADLVVTNGSSDSVSVFKNDGTGTFGGRRTYATGLTPVASVISDLNGDPFPDVAVADSNAGSVTVLLNLGTGTFGAPSSIAVGAEPRSIAAVDLNLDGRMDLIAGLGASGRVAIVAGSPGGFGAVSTLVTGGWAGSLAIGDLDGRPGPDLLVADPVADVVRVFRNDGSGGLVGAATPSVGSDPRALAAADLNGDAKSDIIIVATALEKVQVLLRATKITWTPSQSSRVTNRPKTCNIPEGCTDSGATWTSGRTALAASRQGAQHYLHVVWTTDRPTGDEANPTVSTGSDCASLPDPATGSPPYCSGVYYARSADGGATWSAPYRISPPGIHADRGAVAARGGYVYVTYVTTEGMGGGMCANAPRVLFVAANDDYGSPGSWPDPLQLSSSEGRVDLPSIAASGSDVWVIRTNAANGNVVLERSVNRAGSFSQQVIGHTSAVYDNQTSPGEPMCPGAPTPPGLEGYSGRAAIAGSGELTGATWIQNPSGRAVAKISADAGATWPGGAGGSPCTGGSAACTMHLTPSGALGPADRSSMAAAADAGRLAMSWISASDATSPKGVYVRSYTAASGWGPARLVSCTQNTGSCAGSPAGSRYNSGYAPALSLYGSTGIGLAWSACPYVPSTPSVPCDGSASDPGAEILWKESWDNGATWSAGQGFGTSYELVAGNAAPDSTLNDGPSVVFDTQGSTTSGCPQWGSSPSADCTRYVLFDGADRSGTIHRTFLSSGEQD